jgi:hypothetical protein
MMTFLFVLPFLLGKSASLDPSSPASNALENAAPDSASFNVHIRRMQAEASCAADFDSDGIVATDDLLYLLAVFGRASDCSDLSYRA